MAFQLTNDVGRFVGGGGKVVAVIVGVVGKTISWGKNERIQIGTNRSFAGHWSHKLSFHSKLWLWVLKVNYSSISTLPFADLWPMQQRQVRVSNFYYPCFHLRGFFFTKNILDFSTSLSWALCPSTRPWLFADKHFLSFKIVECGRYETWFMFLLSRLYNL